MSQSVGFHNLIARALGGQSPFTLLLVPLQLQVPINISIPDSAFSNGKGSFNTPLLLPQGNKFIMAMSDSSGFATGGITDVLTVGQTIGGANCNTAGARADFTFDLDSSLQQCQSVSANCCCSCGAHVAQQTIRIQ
jgi:hypothetical protein